MPFDTTRVTAVRLDRDGTELRLSWESPAAPGTFFQVYVDRTLSWWGTARQTWLPWPPQGNGPVAVDIGTVAAADRDSDYSGTLPHPADRCLLSWEGGTYEDPTGNDDLVGWKVYAGPPGSPVGYARPLASVEAYPGGVITDGFGLGPYGHGGFGRSAGAYSWRSGRLSPGTWTFAVCAFDHAGNESRPGRTATFAAAGPPRPPAADPAGVRLRYTYDSATRRATLSWLASPS